MDFSTLLNTAKENVKSSGKKKDSFYSTNFAPPKRQPKDPKLSAGIKKFLEEKKREEEEKFHLMQKKKAEMLSKRDGKVQRQIEKSLKTIKSSKKFMTGDKLLDENTAITLENEQPDEDDYGYVSNISDQFHKKFLEKYQNVNVTTFNDKKRQMKTPDTKRINGKQENQIKTGVRSRKSQVPSESQSHTDNKVLEKEKSNTKKPKFRPAPIVDFASLLKIAEQKQHEDIQIEVPSQKKKEKRLLTSKEKREMEEINAARRARAKRKHQDDLNNSPKKQERNVAPKSSTEESKTLNNPPMQSFKKVKDPNSKLKTNSPTQNGTQKVIKKNPPIVETSILKKKLSETYVPNKLVKPSTSSNSSSKNSADVRQNMGNANKTSRDIPKDLKSKEPTTSRKYERPWDRQPSKSAKHFNMKKRRIEDEDSEYDSEMDDFIDDDDVDLDYSNEIRNIFGYDKSRYQDDDFDDTLMESNYSTVMREETISRKIGMMEDLEDMRREEEELKRKMQMKRKRNK